MSDIENTDNINDVEFSEIKKIIDNNRPKKYTKEDRIKNLQLAREKKIKKNEPNEINNVKDTNTNDTIKKDIELLLKNQNELIENISIINNKLLKKRISKPKSKPKQIKKTLDLTIDDAEINNIINDTDKETKNDIKDTTNNNINSKLEYFINSLKKK
jgi:hypothetical protein